MRNLVFLTILLLFVGCGKREVISHISATSLTTEREGISSELQSLVTEYQNRAEETVNIPVNLITYEVGVAEFPGWSSNTLGGCAALNGTPVEIVISESHWNGMDDNSRATLMFHELGHCIEALGHSYNAGNGSCDLQKEDDTVKVMDSCAEVSETDDHPALHEVPSSSWDNVWSNTSTGLKFNETDYNDMFDAFFGDTE